LAGFSLYLLIFKYLALAAPFSIPWLDGELLAKHFIGSFEL